MRNKGVKNHFGDLLSPGVERIIIKLCFSACVGCNY